MGNIEMNLELRIPVKNFRKEFLEIEVKKRLGTSLYHLLNNLTSGNVPDVLKCLYPYSLFSIEGVDADNRVVLLTAINN